MIIHLKENQKLVEKPENIVSILRAMLGAEDPIDQDKEHFWVFQLSARNAIQKLELISLGTIDQTLVHPREVFTRAIADRCVSIIVAHNHPSGDSAPSPEDIRITERLVQAGEILGIEVIDHIVISDAGYTSFKEKQLL